MNKFRAIYIASRFGFEYACYRCHRPLDNDYEGHLTHRSFDGFFIKTPVDCAYAGHVYKIPQFTVELEDHS